MKLAASSGQSLPSVCIKGKHVEAEAVPLRLRHVLYSVCEALVTPGQQTPALIFRDELLASAAER